ncbi:MAG TPA: glycosyltransferase family 4 protein [Candidatus Aquilonibacter sp.]|nr:glycosyltransferase family 4 protein [Candidatus Aquilonibacter sp.]
MTSSNPRPIRVFTPSYADAANTNAQNLTVKEIVARLPEDFHVTMLCEGDPDPRLEARRHTKLFRCSTHGNTLRLLRHCLVPPPDIYFFPRTGPLDRVFFELKKRLGLKTALITYIVTVMNETTATGLIARSIQDADAVFGNSAHVSETIQQVCGVHASTIYDGVDRRYYFPPAFKKESQAQTVLYAGSFRPYKRAEAVIHEAARLPHVNFRLAGKGETEQHCRELAQQLRCSNVTFLGHLSSASLGQEMRSADIFFFPSVVEGNPQVLLQASACGLPCIAMDSYRSDYVIGGKTGLLALSDAELSSSLDRLLPDASLRRSFGAAAVEHSLQFDWDDIASQWAASFRDAVRQRQLRYRQQDLKQDLQPDFKKELPVE